MITVKKCAANKKGALLSQEKNNIACQELGLRSRTGRKTVQYVRNKFTTWSHCGSASHIRTQQHHTTNHSTVLYECTLYSVQYSRDPKMLLLL